ncbi:hypothetical protein LCL97_21420 [Seohaeicola saemankumensis]|nr:hypothetical protein [Seohaeicola saemankumensis]MCA0873400.1 hypothetical protein [Seohaeicola saemankumensis]
MYLFAAVVAYAASTSASAARSYTCNFDKQCVNDVVPCEELSFPPIFLIEQQGKWAARSVSDFQASFTVVKGNALKTLRLVSTDIDEMASSAALLTIEPEGDALMTTHGSFFGHLKQVTLQGTCIMENG